MSFIPRSPAGSPEMIAFQPLLQHRRGQLAIDKQHLAWTRGVPSQKRSSARHRMSNAQRKIGFADAAPRVKHCQSLLGKDRSHRHRRWFCCASSLCVHQAIAWYHECEKRVKSIRRSKLGMLLRRINNFPEVRTTDKCPSFSLRRQVLARLAFR
jgi:hypothetical protein